MTQIGGVNYAYLPQLMQYMQNPMLQVWISQNILMFPLNYWFFIRRWVRLCFGERKIWIEYCLVHSNQASYLTFLYFEFLEQNLKRKWVFLIWHLWNILFQFALPTSAATASTSTTSAGITPIVTPTIQPSIPLTTASAPTPTAPSPISAPTPIRPEPRQPTTSKTQAEQVKPKPLKKKKKVRIDSWFW